MKHLARITTLAMVMVFSGTTEADNTKSPPEEPGSGVHADEARDWSQTHLFPAPVLLGQIERTNVFLEENTLAMVEDTSELKSEGVLDRRGASRIRNALKHARLSMTKLAEGIGAEGQMDGWSARMISYELGMAADKCSKEVDLIGAEAASSTGSGAGEGAPDSLSSVEKRERRLTQSLRKASDLLKETAQAIVRYLK